MVLAKGISRKLMSMVFGFGSCEKVLLMLITFSSFSCRSMLSDGKHGFFVIKMIRIWSLQRVVLFILFGFGSHVSCHVVHPRGAVVRVGVLLVGVQVDSLGKPLQTDEA